LNSTIVGGPIPEMTGQEVDAHSVLLLSVWAADEAA